MPTTLQDRINARIAASTGAPQLRPESGVSDRISQRLHDRIVQRASHLEVRQIINSGGLSTDEGFRRAVGLRLEARRNELGGKLPPAEGQAILNAFRQLAGKPVLGDFGFDQQGRAVPINRFIEAQNAANRGDPFFDFSQGALRVFGNTGADLVGVVSPETGSDIEFNTAAQFGTEGGIAGQFGEGVAQLAQIGATGGNPLAAGAFFGAQGAGGSRIETFQARQRGVEVSLRDELLAAGLTGAAEGLSGALTAYFGRIGGRALGGLGGQALGRVGGERLAQAAPQLVAAFRAEGQTGVRAVVRNILTVAGVAGEEAVEEGLTQLFTNAISQTFIDPDKTLTEGVDQAAVRGAALSPFAQALLRGVEVSRQRARAGTPQDMSGTDPTALTSGGVQADPQATPPQTEQETQFIGEQPQARPPITDLEAQLIGEPPPAQAVEPTAEERDRFFGPGTAEPGTIIEDRLVRQPQAVRERTESEADVSRPFEDARQQPPVSEPETALESQLIGEQPPVEQTPEFQGRESEIGDITTSLRDLRQQRGESTLAPAQKGSLTRRIRTLERRRANLRRQQRKARGRRPDDPVRVSRQRIQNLISRANTDPRTGAPNFAVLRDSAERAFNRSDTQNKPVAVLKMDLANFKALNDVKGEAEGDRALKIVLDTLQANTRQAGGRTRDTTVAARIGGDENGVLIEGATTEQAQAAARRLEQQINKALQDAGLGRVEAASGARTIEASFGIAVREPGSGETFDQVLQRADAEQKSVATQRKQERAARGEAIGRFDKAEEAAAKTPDEAAALVAPTPQQQADTPPPRPDAVPRARRIEREARQALADPAQADRFAPAFADTIAGAGAMSPGLVPQVTAGQIVDVSAPLQWFRVGRDWIGVLDDAEQKRADLAGPLQAKFNRTYKKLDRKARTWLHEVRPDGYTNAQAAVEAHLFDSDPLDGAPKGAADIIKVLREIQDTTGNAAEDANVKLKAAGRSRAGGKRGFKKAANGRFFRGYTPEGRQMMEFQAGATWDAFVEWLQANPQLNPNIDVSSEATIKAHLERESTSRPGRSGRVRRDRSLTLRRAFRAVPAYLMVAGRRVAILETSVPTVYTRAIDSQSREVGLYRAITEFVNRHQPFRIPLRESLDGNAVDVDVDTLVDRLRRHLVQGAAKAGQRPELAASSFNRTLDAFTNTHGSDLAGEVFFNDPANGFARAGTAVFRNLSASMLSMSGLFDIAQSLSAADTVSIRQVAKAYADIASDFFTRRNGFLAEYRALDAIPQTMLWLSGDTQNRAFDVLGRILPSGVMEFSRRTEVFAQAVTARAFQLYAGNLRPGRLPKAQRRLLHDELRLTPEEIATIQATGPTEAITNKIIRNGVKRTNFLAEDPARRGLVSNSPVLRFLVPFQSFAAGRVRALTRATQRVRDAVQAVGAGDEEAARMLARAIQGWFALIAIALGQGAFQKYLRRMVTGQPVIRPDDPTFLSGDFFRETVRDSAMLGVWSHMANAVDYSGGEPEKLMMNFFPKVGMLVEIGAAFSGWGKYAGTPWDERVVQSGERVNPAFRGLRRWMTNLAYPERKRYNRVRGLARAWVTEQQRDLAPALRRDAVSVDRPENAPMRDAVERIRDDDDDENIRSAIDAYFAFMAENAVSREDARRRLRQSLLARQPVAVKKADRRAFLASLSEADRALAIEVQREYMQRVNRWVPPRN